MIGIINNGPGIGDKIQFTSIPENFYKNTGQKLVDLSNSWVFDHNPYISRDPREVEMVADLWQETLHFPSDRYFTSQGDRFRKLMQLEKTYLRHSRLYEHEEKQGTKPGTISVHTTSSPRGEGKTLPPHVIEQIEKNYKSYTIFQVGGKNDNKTPFIDKLGLPLWETAEIIASSQIFIGINSSMMNIAQCYPRVNRKVFLIENDYIDKKDFEIYRPLTQYKEGSESMWIDYNWQYYNIHEEDLGITFTYKKI